MTTSRFDMHCHSVYSDGTLTVQELFEKAIEAGLSGLSITDHDTIRAYDEAFQLLERTPLKLLPGVEISSAFEEQSVHILAYSFSPKNEQINQFIDQCQKKRSDRNHQILELLQKEGMPLDLEKLKEDIGVIGRPHIAKAMLKMGYIQTMREAFDLYIGDGKKCFVPGQRPQVIEVLKLLHRIRAFGIIAHPHLIRNNRLIKKLLSLPFDGLEAYYAKFDRKEEKKWIQLAKNRNWMQTGGSDFHGEMKPHNPLGASWVGEEVFEFFYQRYLENECLQ